MAQADAKHDVKIQTLELTVDDGTKMRVYVSTPTPAQTKKGAGLIVFQEAFGINKHMREVVQDFAQAGYTVIAPELFHRTAPAGWEDPDYDFPKVMAHYQAVTVETIQADTRACFAWLKSQPQVAPDKIASIGFCLGGKASYIANTTVALGAAISFYGGGIAPDLLPLAEKQNAPILLVWGGLDKHIPRSQTRAIDDALTKAGKIHASVVFSDADHAFTNNDRAVFQPRATNEAFKMAMAFLDDHLKL